MDSFVCADCGQTKQPPELPFHNRSRVICWDCHRWLSERGRRARKGGR